MKFYTDFLALTYSHIEAAKHWWIETFDCQVAELPEGWDNTLPSDVALKFPRGDEPTILLSARPEVDQAKFDRPAPDVSTIYCDQVRKKGTNCFSLVASWLGRFQTVGTWSSSKYATRKCT